MSWLDAKAKQGSAIILSVADLNKPRPQYEEEKAKDNKPVAQEISDATPVEEVNGIEHTIIPLRCYRRDIVAMKIVAERYGVTADELIGYGRTHRIVMARIIFCVLMRCHFHWTFERIGKTLHRHHSTVLYYVVENADVHRNEVEAIRLELVEKGLL